MKRGLGSGGTTLLIILIIIVIAGIILFWNQSSILNFQEQEDKNKLCSDANFISGDFCYEVQNILNINTGVSEAKTILFL